MSHADQIKNVESASAPSNAETETAQPEQNDAERLETAGNHDAVDINEAEDPCVNTTKKPKRRSSQYTREKQGIAALFDEV